MSLDTSKIANTNRDDRGDRQEAEQGRRGRRRGPTTGSAWPR